MSDTALPNDLESVIEQALDEDIGSGDITAQLIPENTTIAATIVAKESGVLCGSPWVDAVFQQLDPDIELAWQLAEGQSFSSGQILLRLKGRARAIMTGERTALNFLQTLSATATQTQQLVESVSHTEVAILDTRKTLPGLRTAQKYAVRVGGGTNHRLGLFDAFLIKENHIAACGGIHAAITAARDLYPNKPVEIEVRDLEELDQALAAKADTVMLDNFGLEELSLAVERNNGQAKLEASGGIDGEALVSIAETGVDYISIGALTKNCRAIDLSLLIG
ncbi:MAG: carboxylating nicotinate-nucleotide diphosphorylase [Pseudomonadales bacterium]|nr:carboxylating nicotinate-nucleotide diphosphorylase [Pseudomonadales bacterium]